MESPGTLDNPNLGMVASSIIGTVALLCNVDLDKNGPQMEYCSSILGTSLAYAFGLPFPGHKEAGEGELSPEFAAALDGADHAPTGPVDSVEVSVAVFDGFAFAQASEDTDPAGLAFRHGTADQLAPANEPFPSVRIQIREGTPPEEAATLLRKMVVSIEEGYYQFPASDK